MEKEAVAVGVTIIISRNSLFRYFARGGIRFTSN